MKVVGNGCACALNFNFSGLELSEKHLLWLIDVGSAFLQLVKLCQQLMWSELWKWKACFPVISECLVNECIMLVLSHSVLSEQSVLDIFSPLADSGSGNLSMTWIELKAETVSLQQHSSNTSGA